jgi:hypothetical protein
MLVASLREVSQLQWAKLAQRAKNAKDLAISVEP